MTEESQASLGASALAVLRVLAQGVAAEKSMTIAPDGGFGTATLIDETGAHTHIGGDWFDNEDTAFESFVHGLHASLCGVGGLSWVSPNTKRTDANVNFERT